MPIDTALEAHAISSMDRGVLRIACWNRSLLSMSASTRLAAAGAMNSSDATCAQASEGRSFRRSEMRFYLSFEVDPRRA